MKIFISVRNAGNLIPNQNLSGIEEITTESAALELGCLMNGIKHVIVCGHSDCKVSVYDDVFLSFLLIFSLTLFNVLM